MASVLSPLYAGDLPAKPIGDGSMSAAARADQRIHSSADNLDSSGKHMQKSEQWQPSVEVLEGKRASKKHEEERKRFLAHEANEFTKYSSFEDETTHPVPEKMGDHHKETTHSFLRKGSMELFSSQALFQPFEQKEIDAGMQGKWEVKEGQSFEEKMDLESAMQSKTLQRGTVYTCWCSLVQQTMILHLLISSIDCQDWLCFLFLTLLKSRDITVKS